jgi:hypothetical protein
MPSPEAANQRHAAHSERLDERRLHALLSPVNTGLVGVSVLSSPLVRAAQPPRQRAPRRTRCRVGPSPMGESPSRAPAVHAHTHAHSQRERRDALSARAAPTRPRSMQTDSEAPHHPQGVCESRMVSTANSPAAPAPWCLRETRVSVVHHHAFRWRPSGSCTPSCWVGHQSGGEAPTVLAVTLGRGASIGSAQFMHAAVLSARSLGRGPCLTPARWVTCAS